ncbi:TrmH family RNA methyltransferase [Desulfovibrio aminophilus]|uniref:RNA methyltransferase n=1 Tax=Desulfovibrio aminophilus TaxID=81425 RepID=UPI003398BB78
MLDGLRIVLVHTRFPENIGSAARACLNMGCRDLVLVAPERLDLERALPLATVHAKDILTSARVVGALPEALADCAAAYGTTARLGGWRQAVSTPRTLAAQVVPRLERGERLALVFGPEDQGLTNEETMILDGLCSIPTAVEGTSLNLAQAVMVLLYECFEARRRAAQPASPTHSRHGLDHQEREALAGALREALLAIGYLKEQNTDYWLLPVRRTLSRLDPSRAEFNMLMGVCRQILWLAGKTGKTIRDTPEAL